METSEMSNQWTIIYTYHDHSIHLEHIKHNNPSAQVIAVYMNDIPRKKQDNRFAWRNCDSIVRTWLKNNLSLIDNKNVAIFEWDVLVTKTLDNISIDHFYFNRVKHPEDKWYWFKESAKLKHLEKYKLGVLPFGVLFANKELLKEFIDPSMDYLYEEDIISELRVGTHINYCNLPLRSLQYNTIATSIISHNIQQGIYHPVKERYENV